MSKMFELSEVIQVAVNDEKSGVAFYSTLAQKVRDPAVRTTFAALANQERFHQKQFETMLKMIGEYQPAEQYDDEYVNYVHALTSDRAFPDEQAAIAAATECQDDLVALAAALRIERDTLVLLGELRSMVREKDRATVDIVIREERQHVTDLTAARKRLLDK